MKSHESMATGAKQSEQLFVRTAYTTAHKMMIASGKHPEKQIALAAARIDLTKANPPRLLAGLQTPTFGIVRNGADAFVLDAFPGDGQDEKVRGDGPMRATLQIPSAANLIRGAACDGTTAWLWTGLGNTGLNKGCVAWAGGVLHHSVQDYELLLGYDFDGCIWWKKEPRRVTLDRVRFIPANRSGSWEPVVGGQRVGKDVSLIVCGQRLIERGVPIDPCSNAHSRFALSYVDLRHLILDAFTSLTYPGTLAPVLDGNKEQVRRDFGLDQILSSPEKLRSAIEGKVVHLRLELTDVDGTWYEIKPEDLESAFIAKSYRRCETLEELMRCQREGERGLFLIDVGKHICYQVYARSPYPLHFLAVRKNGDAVFVDGVVGGFSNNAGATVQDLALHLRLSGYQEALLLDNGGDVVMVYNNAADWPDPNGRCAVVPSSLKRTQWAALLLYQGETADGIEVRHSAKNGELLAVEW